MKTTLLIMAAGLGSRYGGNKQIDHIGPHGEILLEYSIYDAMAAGFDKVVFVIKRSMADTFRELIGDKIAKKVEVEYAYQEYDSLPDGFVPPEGRTKPYGTVHAVLVAKDLIHEPFAVINADDYYGKDAFATMAKSLKEMQGKTNVASMVAYRLKNTVSENGHVTRGVCARDDKNHLMKVQETYKIKPFPDGTIRDVNFREEGDILDPEALVSMNFWGLTPWFFGAAARDFAAFLRADNGDPMKKEFVLPTEIDALMHSDGLTVDVLSTDAVWFGVTYREDKPACACITVKGSPSFGGLYDVGASLDRADRGGCLSPEELLRIAAVLKSARQTKAYSEGEGRSAQESSVLDVYFQQITTNKYLEERIFTSILSKDEIADAASSELASIRRKIRQQSSKIRESLQKIITSPSYAKILQEPIVTIRSDRFVVPVKAECKSQLPGLVHDVSASGSTYFIEPMSAVNGNNELRELFMAERKEIERILAQNNQKNQ